MTAATGQPRSTKDYLDALHSAATEASGLDDFGIDDYLDGLTLLVDEIASQHDDPTGAEAAITQTALRPLVGRLLSEDAWQRNPDVLDRPVPAPVVITGIPRTGTTALHKLLSMDERFQVLESWLLQHPMPRPPRATWGDQPGYQEAVASLDLVPEVIRKFHMVEPHEADECLLLMAQSFVSNMFGSTQLLPTYDRWFLSTDMTPSFSRYADQLRLIGAGDARPWLLKNPSHLLCLDELFRVFPDAQVIQTHRPVHEAMGSLVSLLSGMTGGDPLPRAEREMRLWGEATRRADAAREGREGRFCDVDYRDMVRDPMAVVRAIYDRLGLELDDVTRRRMEQWIVDNPQGKHGEHRYDPSALGVTPEALESHFGRYIRQHGLA